MKSWIGITALVFTTMGAIAGERVDENMKVDKDVYVDIEHTNGDAKVFGWDKDEVQVRGELDDKAKEFIFEKRGGTVIIHVKMEKSRSWSSNKYKGDDLEIFVPMGARVEYTSVNADVQFKDLNAGLKAETVNGDIDVRDIVGRIRLETVNGGIDARNLDGDLNFETVNGEINDEKSSGSEATYASVNGEIMVNSSVPEVMAESVNGDLELKLGMVQKIEMTTVNGTIDVHMDLMEGGTVEGSNVSGRINLSLQNDVSAEFDIDSHAGGRLVNNLTDDDVRKAKYGPGRWLDFTTRGGKGKVELSTVSGRIELEGH